MSHQQEPTPAEVYEQYLGPTISAPWTRVLLEYADPQPGEHVLDVACGTGSVARHVAPMVDTHGKIVALDVNPNMLAVARAPPEPAGSTITWQQANAVSLDLADGAFDLVLCQQGLQFFSDRTAAVCEMRRVLTKNGRVVIGVWQALPRHPMYEAARSALVKSVIEETSLVTQLYRDRDTLTFPMHAHIAAAYT